MMTRLYIKAVSLKERLKAAIKDNRGQGAVDTAVICEPFSWEWKV